MLFVFLNILTAAPLSQRRSRVSWMHDVMQHPRTHRKTGSFPSKRLTFKMAAKNLNTLLASSVNHADVSKSQFTISSFFLTPLTLRGSQTGSWSLSQQLMGKGRIHPPNGSPTHPLREDSGGSLPCSEVSWQCSGSVWTPSRFQVLSRPGFWSGNPLLHSPYRPSIRVWEGLNLFLHRLQDSSSSPTVPEQSCHTPLVVTADLEKVGQNHKLLQTGVENPPIRAEINSLHVIFQMFAIKYRQQHLKVWLKWNRACQSLQGPRGTNAAI